MGDVEQMEGVGCASKSILSSTYRPDLCLPFPSTVTVQTCIEQLPHGTPNLQPALKVLRVKEFAQREVLVGLRLLVKNVSQRRFEPSTKYSRRQGEPLGRWSFSSTCAAST